MDKKVFINILIGKEEEDLLKLMDKKELKKLEKTFNRIKPALDRLGTKETTDKDIKDFIKLIESNLLVEFVKKLENLPYRIYEVEMNSGTKVMKLQVLHSDWFNLLNEYKGMIKEYEI